mgnify:CR=1 FL=1
MLSLEDARKADFPAVDFSFTERDLIIYALGVGCTRHDLKYVYENHDDFSALPSFGVIPSFGCQVTIPFGDYIPKFDFVNFFFFNFNIFVFYSLFFLFFLLMGINRVNFYMENNMLKLENLSQHLLH